MANVQSQHLQVLPEDSRGGPRFTHSLATTQQYRLADYIIYKLHKGFRNRVTDVVQVDIHE